MNSLIPEPSGGVGNAGQSAQPPQVSSAGVMRVIMDEEQLHRLLQPILDEVNRLRQRILVLEAAVLDDGR